VVEGIIPGRTEIEPLRDLQGKKGGKTPDDVEPRGEFLAGGKQDPPNPPHKAGEEKQTLIKRGGGKSNITW